MVFSCTTTSNQKLGQGPVTFEQCPMAHDDFSKDSGVFSCKESGQYSFTLTSLMKSEENSPVKIKMMMQDRRGRVSIRRTYVSISP